MKRGLTLILAGMIGLSLLAGCGRTETDFSEPTVTTTTDAAVTTTTSISAQAESVEPSTTTEPTHTQESTTDTTRETTTTTAKTTTANPILTFTSQKQTTTTATTTATTTTTTTAPDPNRVLINGKAYAVGDTMQYTVYVKTTENYGTVKVGVRCLQKGLEIPDGTFQKQNQYVMKNLGVGRLGTTPEDTIGNNGFVMTVNKGYTLDSSVSGSAGITWFYETTNYDYSTQAYREIDCSKGVALFTIALKITKPGEYTIDCMEYPNKSRSDLTIWGEFS